MKVRVGDVYNRADGKIVIIDGKVGDLFFDSFRNRYWSDGQEFYLNQAMALVSENTEVKTFQQINTNNFFSKVLNVR